MNKLIIILLGSIMLYGCNNNKIENLQTNLKFKSDTINFPKTLKGDTINFKYEFTATGKEPFKIEDVKAGCGCSVPEYDSLRLFKNGDTGSIRVQYHTNEDTGNVIKHLVVKTSNDPKLHILYFIGKIR